MTQQEKAEIREISREIVKEVLREHIKTCPHHQLFLITKAKFIGIAIGIIIASGVTSGTATSMAVKLFLG